MEDSDLRQKVGKASRYWLVDGDCSEEDWRDIEARLISFFESDLQIKNPSRVMRLPHFNHISYSEESGWQYKRVRLVEFKTERRYSVEHMRKAYPLAEVPTSSKKGDTPDFSTWQFTLCMHHPVISWPM